MSIHASYQAITAYLSRRVMTDDLDFIGIRARDMIARNKPDVPFVVTPAQWLLLDRLFKEACSRADDAGNELAARSAALALSRQTADEWKALYETTLVTLREVEAQRNLFETANSLAENALRELTVRLNTAEARVVHLQALVRPLDKEEAPG